MEQTPQIVLREILHCIELTKIDAHKNFAKYICKYEKILLTGAGRVGLVMQTFAMRLTHLGFSAHYLGDATVPSFGEGDLIIIGSGSGSTPSVLTTANVAHSKKLDIALITCTQNSDIGKISNHVFLISAPSKINSLKGVKSIQPMTTLFEQTLFIYLDSVVLELMKIREESSSQMWGRHNVIE